MVLHTSLLHIQTLSVFVSNYQTMKFTTHWHNLLHSKWESSKRKHRVYTVNNKPLVRLYYWTRHGLPTTYIIPPLLSLATISRLLKFYEEHAKSTHKNTVRVCFQLPNNEIVLPTDPNYSPQDEKSRLASTDNIEGKLLLHPHTDLLCIVNRVYTVNNKPLVRLYYCTRNGAPTTYIIPPLLSFATTCRLLKLYEEHARSAHNNPVYSPHMSSHASSRQEEHNSSYTVYHHSMNTRLIN